MDINKSLLLQNPRLYTGSTTGLLESANNLSDVDDATTARENLGVTDEIETQNGYTLQRRMASRVISDGATTSRGRILTPGAIGAVAGLPITIEAEVPPVLSNPASTARIIYMGPVNTNIGTGSPPLVNAMQLSVTTSGGLIVKAYLASGTDREFLLAGYVSNYGSKRQRITCVFTAGDSTTDPVFHITGVNVSSAMTPNTSGGGTNWMSATFNPVYYVEASDWPSGDAPIARVVIGAYSDAEAVTWTAGGQRPAWAELAGTAVVQTSGTLTIGRRYYIKSYVASDSFTNVGAGSNATGVSFTATGTTPTTWTNSSQLIPAGLIDNPHPQPGLTSFDSLGRMSRRNVGHVNVTDRDTVTIYGNTSSATAEQLLGGAVLSSANDIVIDHIEQSTASGTPTTSIGYDATTNIAAYKTSGALAAGLNVFTPVTRKPGGTSIWATSNDTTKVRTVVHGHKVSVPVS